MYFTTFQLVILTKSGSCFKILYIKKSLRIWHLYFLRLKVLQFWWKMVALENKGFLRVHRWYEDPIGIAPLHHHGHLIFFWLFSANWKEIYKFWLFLPVKEKCLIIMHRRWKHCGHKGMDMVSNNSQVDCGV